MRLRGCLGIFLFIFLLSACQQSETISVRPVRAEQVRITAVSGHYSYSGVVRAHHDITLAFQVGGKVASRKVEVGDTVHAGQVLAELDTRDLVLDVQNTQAELASAKSNLEFTKTELSRYVPLLKTGNVSQSFYQQTKTKYETDSASVDRTTSALELAKRKLAYATLTAEYPGIITKLDITAGQVVAAGQAVMQLARNDEKEIIINVPEQRIQQWQQRNQIDVVLWAYPEKKYTAKIREISGEADPATRTYTVKLSVIDADATMRLGMTANVQVDDLRKEPKIVVPLTAIYYESKAPMIWVIDIKSMTVNPVKVVLGEYEDNKIIVNSGIKNNQWIVTAGVNGLRPGQKIKFVTE